jgi:hypothetical protein
MMLHSTDPTLYALFCLSRNTLPIHSGSLARLTGRSASQLALDLLQLESLGLIQVSDERTRLTMLGLARAAQLARASGEGSRRAQRPQKVASAPAVLKQIKPPVAAKRQLPALPPALSA